LGEDTIVVAGFTVKVKNSDRVIKRKIMHELSVYLTFIFAKASIVIQDQLRIWFEEMVLESSTYQSLVGVGDHGSLKGHFGLEFPDDDVAGLINVWKKEIVVKFSSLSGGVSENGFQPPVVVLKIDMIDLDWEAVLNSGFGSYVNFRRGTTPSDIDWLDWLLLKGDQTQIVKGYDILWGEFLRAQSRSGLAVMFPDKKTGWRVPSEYAGTKTNNWITKVLSDNVTLARLESIVQTAVNGVM
jgi:hypothetical protein